MRTDQAGDDSVIERILEAVENGQLDRDHVILSCLKYMGEKTTADMAFANEFFLFAND